MKTQKVKASTLSVGDITLPPEREIRLWMRKHLIENNMSESALNLQITDIHEGSPDKNGKWLIVIADQNSEWVKGRANPMPFKFKVRPDTFVPKIKGEI